MKSHTSLLMKRKANPITTTVIYPPRFSLKYPHATLTVFADHTLVTCPPKRHRNHVYYSAPDFPLFLRNYAKLPFTRGPGNSLSTSRKLFAWTVTKNTKRERWLFLHNRSRSRAYTRANVSLLFARAPVSASRNFRNDDHRAQLILYIYIP